ncbi:Uncharacterised protein [Bordetella pertussis]|nr:Uncharacterised protein [Bordetella pertussis]
MRSIPLAGAPLARLNSSCSDLPASSSRWARVRLTVFSSSPTKNESVPPSTTGSSYWLIW